MDISFSTRFENILKITDSFVGRGKDIADARDEAKFLESSILNNAQSTAEYQDLCDELSTQQEHQHTDLTTNNESIEVDEVFNEQGPTIGRYEYATFHRDGQMSTLFKAKAIDPSADVKIVALKVTTPSQMQPPHNIQREARFLVVCRHKHVVELIDSFWYQSDRFVLTFPFFRQDLENLLRTRTLTPKQHKLVLEGLFAALAHIHSLGLVHRDVKPSNILLKTMNGPVVLADFGIAWSPTDPQSEPANSKITDVGTTCYRPPELLFGHKSYDTSLDMWAAGCVVAEMASDEHEQLFDPGPLGSELGLIKSIFTTLGTPDQHTWPSVVNFPDWGKMRFQDFPAKPWATILNGASIDAVDLVDRTVHYESTQRLTAAEALQHPAVTKMLV